MEFLRQYENFSNSFFSGGLTAIPYFDLTVTRSEDGFVGFPGDGVEIFDTFIVFADDAGSLLTFWVFGLYRCNYLEGIGNSFGDFLPICTSGP